jgi:hypothetical protein
MISLNLLLKISFDPREISHIFWESYPWVRTHIRRQVYPSTIGSGYASAASSERCLSLERLIQHKPLPPVGLSRNFCSHFRRWANPRSSLATGGLCFGATHPGGYKFGKSVVVSSVMPHHLHFFNSVCYQLVNVQSGRRLVLFQWISTTIGS